MSTPVLVTKLFIPAPRPELVLRPRLIERLNEGLRRKLSPDEQRTLLRRLTEVDALERFIHRKYVNVKRFSIEGTDALVPMLDIAIHDAATFGAREVVMGMAHRGRINVLAHILGKPYSTIFDEFDGKHADHADSEGPKHGGAGRAGQWTRPAVRRQLRQHHHDRQGSARTPGGLPVRAPGARTHGRDRQRLRAAHRRTDMTQGPMV